MISTSGVNLFKEDEIPIGNLPIKAFTTNITDPIIPDEPEPNNPAEEEEPITPDEPEPNNIPDEREAVNSDFSDATISRENLVVNIKRSDYSFDYSITYKIDGIEIGDPNDAYEYAWAVSDKDNDSNLTFNNMSEKLKRNTDGTYYLEFTVSSNDLKEYADKFETDSTYIYIKETATYGSNVALKTTSFKPSINIEDGYNIYIENELVYSGNVVEELNSNILKVISNDKNKNNNNNNTDNQTDKDSDTIIETIDETTAKTSLPDTGTKTITTVVIAFIVIGTSAYVVYIINKRKIK